MPRVTILDTGNTIDGENQARAWSYERPDLYVDTDGIRDLLGSKTITDKLVLAIRDTIIIKALRSNRNIIVGGNNNQLEQIERIAEVVEAQDLIDRQNGEEEKVKYSWKVKRF